MPELIRHDLWIAGEDEDGDADGDADGDTDGDGDLGRNSVAGAQTDLATT